MDKKTLNESNSKRIFVFVLITLTILVIFFPSISFSLSVLPSEKVYYLDNANDSTFEGSFIIFDSVDENNIVSISYNDSLSQYIAFDKSSFSFRSQDSQQKVNYVFYVKDLAAQPGTHIFPIVFTQKILSETEGISAQISIVAKIIVIVPYPDMFAEIKQKLDNQQVIVFIFNKGQDLFDCSLEVGMKDYQTKQQLLKKSFQIPVMFSQEQRSFALNINDFPSNAQQIAVETSLVCNDYELNKSTLLKIPKFPYNLSVSLINKDEKSVELLVAFKNRLSENLNPMQVFYEVQSNGRKTKTNSFYLPELKPLESKTTTLLIPLTFPVQNNFSIIFYVKQGEQIVSETRELSLTETKSANYKVIMYILFIVLLVLIASFRIKSKRIKN